MTSPTTSPEICRRCAAQGTSCCTSPFGVSLAPLTPVEVARIAARTERPPDAFTTARPLDDEEREALWEQDPALHGLGADNTLVSLRLVDGRCVFLTDTGCQLGADR